MLCLLTMCLSAIEASRYALEGSPSLLQFYGKFISQLSLYQHKKSASETAGSPEPRCQKCSVYSLVRNCPRTETESRPTHSIGHESRYESDADEYKYIGKASDACKIPILFNYKHVGVCYLVVKIHNHQITKNNVHEDERGGVG